MGNLPLCACGCGQPVAKIANLYIQGHARRGKKYKRVAKKEEAKPGEPDASKAQTTTGVSDALLVGIMKTLESHERDYKDIRAQLMLLRAEIKR